MVMGIARLGNVPSGSFVKAESRWLRTTRRGILAGSGRPECTAEDVPHGEISVSERIPRGPLEPLIDGIYDYICEAYQPVNHLRYMTSSKSIGAGNSIGDHSASRASNRFFSVARQKFSQNANSCKFTFVPGNFGLGAHHPRVRLSRERAAITTALFLARRRLRNQKGELTGKEEQYIVEKPIPKIFYTKRR